VSTSVKIDGKSDDYNEDRVVPEGDVGDVVSVLVPRATALNLHALAVVLADRCLHDVFVPRIFFQIDERFLRLKTDLLGESVFPILSVCSSLPPFFTVLIIVDFFLDCIRSTVSLRVLSHEVWDQLFDHGSRLCRSELVFEGGSDRVLRLRLRLELLNVLHCLLWQLI